MDGKFQKGELAFVPPSDRDKFVDFRPYHLLLYDTLMDLVQLRKVLQLENTPSLQPATIVRCYGTSILLWFSTLATSLME